MTFAAPPPRHSTMSAPAPEAMLGGLPTESWLKEHASNLASSSDPLDRVAAVGLLARLWMPAGKPSETQGVRPAQTAREWVGGLSNPQIDELTAKATLEAAALCDAFSALPTSLPSEKNAAREAVLKLVYRRDDLESVAAILRMRGREAPLREYLRLVDREAEAQLSALSLVEGLEQDERLEQVAWQEPLSWWGRFAEGLFRIRKDIAR